jgi:hypothetical protein
LDQIGDEIMTHIADLIPQEEAGLFSKDPLVREAAKGTEYYPWEGIREGQDDYPGGKE